MKNSKQKRFAHLLGAFRISKHKPKRAKLGPQRREEVKAVRKQRACLRCSLLKIKCSHDDVCTTCAQLVAALHRHQKQTLSFSGCIRTKLSEVSIFELYLPSCNGHTLLMEKSEELALSGISLTFATDIKWDLDLLVKDTLDWLNSSAIPKISRVGTLSSPKFLDLVKTSAGQLVEANFQRMLYAISLAYTQPIGTPLTIAEIHEIGCISGHAFLEVLDQWLKPQSLQKCSLNDLRTLFLMVFGTVLAVSYCDPLLDQPATDSGYSARDMQSHICQILAHYIIYLGSQLGLPITEGVDQLILEGSPSKWNKPGVFDWDLVEDDNNWQEPADEVDLIRFYPQSYENKGIGSADLKDVLCTNHFLHDQCYNAGEFSEAQGLGSYFARSPVPAQQPQQDCLSDSLMCNQEVLDVPLSLAISIARPICYRPTLSNSAIFPTTLHLSERFIVPGLSSRRVHTLAFQAQSLAHENESGWVPNDGCLAKYRCKVPQYRPGAGPGHYLDENPKEDRQFICPQYGCSWATSKRCRILRHVNEVHLPCFPGGRNLEWNTISTSRLVPNGSSPRARMQTPLLNSHRCPPCLVRKVKEASVCNGCAATTSTRYGQRLLV